MIKINIKNIIVITCLLVLVGCSNSNKIVSPTDLPLMKTNVKISENDISLTNLPDEDTSNEDIMSTTIPDLNVANPKIIVKKADRKLYLLDEDTVVATFNIGLGFTPEGHKIKEGDGKTPEGEYYICTKNANSKFYLSLGLSYPNKEDAQQALDDGRISTSTYNKIAKAIDEGKKPPWNTPLGGEIMIHGNGSSRDWTAGCIAVDDEIMDLLFEICDTGTQVIIN